MAREHSHVSGPHTSWYRRETAPRAERCDNPGVSDVPTRLGGCAAVVRAIRLPLVAAEVISRDTGRPGSERRGRPAPGSRAGCRLRRPLPRPRRRAAAPSRRAVVVHHEAAWLARRSDRRQEMSASAFGNQGSSYAIWGPREPGRHSALGAPSGPWGRPGGPQDLGRRIVRRLPRVNHTLVVRVVVRRRLAAEGRSHWAADGSDPSLGPRHPGAALAALSRAAVHAERPDRACRASGGRSRTTAGTASSAFAG